MTAEQKAAFIMAQAASALATVAGMQAENQQRMILGQSIAYPEDAFTKIETDYIISHNAVIAFFRAE